MDFYKGRKNYFIDKRLQTKFVIHFFLLTFVPLVLTLGVVLFFSKGSYTVGIENAEVSAKTTANFFFSMALPMFLVVLIFSTAVTALSMLLFSHRISGPLSRLIQEVYLLEKGDLTQKFEIRDKDHIKDFSERLSQMSANFRVNFVDLKEQYLSLRKILEEKDFLLSETDKKQARELLQSIEQKLNQFKTS